MTDPNPYYVRIALGDPTEDYAFVYDWDLAYDPDRSVVSDGIAVLSGLRFGWSMPADQLWPVQPNPMTAGFTINLPNFSDLADIDEGWKVLIEVRFDPEATDAVFAFYGRVTDLEAATRTWPRPGVFLSVVAVDYTVDPNVLVPGFALGSDSSIAENAFLGYLWANTGYVLGSSPDWPIFIDGVQGNGDNAQPARTIIDTVLLQACTDNQRIIFSPIVSFAGTLQPPDGGGDPTWAFDLLAKIPETDDKFVISAGLIDRGIRWNKTKRRTQPTRVEAIGADGVLIEAADSLATPTVLNRIETISLSSTRLLQVANFYLPAAPTRAWAVDRFRYLLSRADLTDFPLDLMPRWRDAAGSLSRCACYRKTVVVEGMATDVNPYADDSVSGVPTAVDFSISDGQMYLDLTLRQVEPAPIVEG